MTEAERVVHEVRSEKRANWGLMIDFVSLGGWTPLILSVFVSCCKHVRTHARHTHQEMEEEMKPETLRSAKAFVLKWGIAFTVLMLGLWPALSLPAGTLYGYALGRSGVAFHESKNQSPITPSHTFIQAPPSPSPISASGFGSASSGAS